MAQDLTLDECVELTQGILFDTSALFDLYRHVVQRGTPDPRLLRVIPGARYTTVVNLYEFLCGIGVQERQQRIEWLQESAIKTFQLTRGTSQTFHNLGRLIDECGHVADLLVGATATAEHLAVASRDRDFSRMDQVIRVSEFTP